MSRASGRSARFARFPNRAGRPALKTDFSLGPGPEGNVIDREIDDAISQLITQWNIAERRIKKAEQVDANEVVTSAIFELRYAGRKFIDAHQLLLSGKWQDDEQEKRKILASLADATEDCVKAKHDAIDAMMLFVASWFDRTERTLGLSEVQKYFPDYIAITGKIDTIQDKIAESRGDRMVSRDPSYDVIEIEDYTEVLYPFGEHRGEVRRRGG